MTTTARTAALLLVALAACQPGASPHPSSPATGLAISGAVSGAGVPVTVRATGPVEASAQPDFAGRYTLSNLPRGVYTLTVQAPRTVAFAPDARQVTLFDGPVTGQDFTGSTVAVLEGTLAGPGAAGATVTLRGPVERAVVSAPGGYYRLDDLPGGTYAVAAAGAGFGYSPVSVLVTLGPGAVTTRDFTSTAQASSHAITGAVVGPAPAGVLLTLGGGPTGLALGQTLSDAAGRWRFDGLADGDYQVMADPVAGYLWQARARAATVAGADVTGLDFTEVTPKVARWAYVQAQALGGVSQVIYQYAVGADGALAPLDPATVPTAGAGPLVADPAGRWLYALASGAGGAIAQFAIGPGGALTPLATPTVTGLVNPGRLAMDPLGRWLWVLDASGNLWRYALGADGQLSSPVGFATGATTDLLVHPSGAHLYVAGGTAVYHFLVAADGTLTAATPASVGLPGGLDPTTQFARLALDPRGEFAYASAFDRTTGSYRGWLLTYAVDAGGAMTSLGGSVPAQGFSQINFGPQQVAVDASGRFAWVAPDGSAYYASSGVARYRLGTDGLPTLLGSYDPLPLASGQGQNCPARLAPDPSGTRLYAASSVVDGAREATARVAWFTIRADGAVLYGGDLPIGLMAQSLVLVAY